MLTPRLDVPPCDSAAALSLARDLGMSFPVGQVLVRRGIGDRRGRARVAGGAATSIRRRRSAGAGRRGRGDAAPRRGRDADHRPRRLRRRRRDVDGDPRARAARGRRRRRLVPAVARRGRLRAGGRDGRAARRARDQAAGHDRLRDHRGRRGRAGARRSGSTSSSPTTTRRAPTAGCPTRRSSTRRSAATRARTCAPAASPTRSRARCWRRRATTRRSRWPTSTSSRWRRSPTASRCVGENRRLVRPGPGGAGADREARPARADARRARRPDAGRRARARLPARRRGSTPPAGCTAPTRRWSCCSPTTRTRAREIAEELDRANADRRFVEQRIRFEAEAQVAELGEQPAYVLWADGWHAGVIGIVASRIAERHHRPVVMIALREGEAEGTGLRAARSRRSTCLVVLTRAPRTCSATAATAPPRAARSRARRWRRSGRRSARTPRRCCAPEDLVPVERVDAVVSGDELGTGPGRGARAAGAVRDRQPVGVAARPGRAAGRPAGRWRRASTSASRSRPAGSGRAPSPSGWARCPRAPPTAACTRPSRWSSTSGRARSSRASSCASSCPRPSEAPELVGEPDVGSAEWSELVLAAATVRARWSRSARRRRRRGAIRARRRAARRAAPPQPATLAAAAARALARSGSGGGAPSATGAAPAWPGRSPRSSTPASRCSSSPPTARPARAQLTGRLGGFAITSWDALERDPALADGYHHVVALDPPLHPDQQAVLTAGDPTRMAHLAWGEPELRYSRDVLDRDTALRPALVGAYRALRDGRIAARRARPPARARRGPPARRPGRARPRRRRSRRRHRLGPAGPAHGPGALAGLRRRRAPPRGGDGMADQRERDERQPRAA